MDFDLYWSQVKILLLFLGPRNTKLLIGSNLVWLVIPGVPFAGAVALPKGAILSQRFRYCASRVSSRNAYACIRWSVFSWPVASGPPRPGPSRRSPWSIVQH